jgi:hypothetical protein
MCKGVGVVRDIELKLEDGEASHTQRWSGGRGYLRRGKWRGGESVVSGRDDQVCV